MMDDAAIDGDQPNNPFNFRENRGRSNFDVPHRFVTSFIWQLPALKGRGVLLRQTLGGWETNGIIQLQSGRWMSMTSGRDNSRPSAWRTRKPLLQYHGLRPKSGRHLRHGWKKHPRRAGPGQATVDFGVIKSIALREALRLQFRTEMFNLLNRVNLGNPNTIASSALFGQITSAGPPRVVQLALRVRF